MKKKIKTLITIAAFGAGTLAIFGGSSYANNIAAENLSPMPNTPPPTKLMKGKRCMPNPMMKPHNGPWHLGLMHNKQLTQSNANTLVSAALLMQGRHDLKVGQIKALATPKGHTVYLVNIVEKNNQAVTQVVVNSDTGMIHPAKAPNHHKPSRA